jgi:hypothetical protein
MSSSHPSSTINGEAERLRLVGTTTFPNYLTMAYSDTEQRREYAEDMENHEREKKPRKSRIYKIVHFFGGGIYAPDASVFDPIEVLLNTKNPEERDRLTDRWKDNRLQELNFVGVVVGLGKTQTVRQLTG